MSEAPRAITRPPAVDLALLAVAVTAVSTSGPIIASMTAPALAIAFWRCLLATGATFPFAWWRHRAELTGLTRTELRATALAGLLLAGHFAAWLPSLRFTSVASSTALVATQPVWAALIAWRSGARVSRGVWVGIAVAFAGVLLLTGIDLTLDPRSLVGDALALVAAMLAAVYVTVGERVRQTVSTPSYTTIAYGVAALALLVLCLVTGSALGGYPRYDWLGILALTAGAQLLGHTLINRVLRTTPATVASLAILFELPGAVLIAALWLGQVPPLAVVPALVLLFVGLVVVIRTSDSREPVESPPV